MAKRADPKAQAGNEGIGCMTPQLVMDGVRYSQIALHTYRSEEERAGIDGAEVDKTAKGTQKSGEGPAANNLLCKLEEEEKQEAEVRNGQIEEQDAVGCGLDSNLLDESIEGQQVGGKAN